MTGDSAGVGTKPVGGADQLSRLPIVMNAAGLGVRVECLTES